MKKLIPFFIMLFWLVLPVYAGGNSALAAYSVDSDEFLSGWKAYEIGLYEEAIESWLPLAQNGHVSAQLNLGTLYDYGMGVEQNEVQAVHWYQKAAHQGNAAAQFNLGMMHSDGRGVAQDYSQAMKWFTKAAEQGLAIAQYNLGQLYQKGQGVQKSLDAGIEWFYQAALGFKDRGDFDSASNSITAIKQIDPQHIYLEKLAKAGLDSRTLSITNSAVTHEEAVSIGTGWPIYNGYIVTNNHVVEEGSDVFLINAAGDQIPAYVVLRDAIHDIALILASDMTKLPAALPLSETSAAIGSEVFTVGFPRVDVLGETPKFSDGVINSNSGFNGDTKKYQISVPIQPGNSGGPLVNMQGEVVGIITSMLGTRNSVTGEEQALANVAFALKIDVLKKLLSQVEPALLMDELPSSSGNIEVLAGRIQDSVIMVLAK